MIMTQLHYDRVEDMFFPYCSNHSYIPFQNHIPNSYEKKVVIHYIMSFRTIRQIKNNPKFPIFLTWLVSWSSNV